MPKVATAIQTIKNLSFTKNLVTVGSSIKDSITSALKAIQAGISNVWQGVKGFVTDAWKYFADSSHFKWISKQFTNAWNHAPKALHNFKDNLVKWAQDAWDFTKKSYDFLLGNRLDPSTTNTFKYAGNLNNYFLMLKSVVKHFF